MEGHQQNSLDSVKDSFERNYEMVEFDVRLTKDDVVILFHDDRFEKKRVRGLTLKELQKLTPVSTLEDVFKWFRKEVATKSFKLNIEIKSRSIVTFRLEHEVVRLIQQYAMQRHVLISSFNPFTLSYLRFNAPEIFRSLLVTREKEIGNFKLIQKRRLNFMCFPDALHLRHLDWDSKAFAPLLKLKIPIILWTCNDAEQAALYIQQGVSGIISDTITPEALNEALARVSNQIEGENRSIQSSPKKGTSSAKAKSATKFSMPKSK